MAESSKRINCCDTTVETLNGTSLSPDKVEALLSRLDGILRKALDREVHSAARCLEADRQFEKSARNLQHYLALRNEDLRPLQEQLAHMGLSSLGRTEAHVLASLTAVRNVLCRLLGNQSVADPPAITFDDGAGLLARHTEALFGPAPAGRNVRIMVTLPAEAADNYTLVRDLMAAGMDCARINCAHDNAETWARAAANVHRASVDCGRTCKILMDLNGPKLRTGPLDPGPKVVHWKPYRDTRGRVIAPARVWLIASGAPVLKVKGIDAVLPVDEAWLTHLQAGDRLQFIDARGKKRSLDVLERHLSSCLALGYESAYVETGTNLRLRQTRGRRKDASEVGELPAAESSLLLKRGETLILAKEMRPGRLAERAEDGSVLSPARISCTLPQVFSDVQPGDVVKFDDGKIEGIVRAISAEEIHVEITYAKEGGSKLRADKSINFPNTALSVGGLTDKDREDLAFIVQHADLVGLSFVNSAADVIALYDAMAERKADHVGILLKIETRRGFERLSSILMTAMRRYPLGIMIARGDLAVEIGWERLAEVQEEMLWLCEAAHVPVVWATQVLETLTKTGQPSRAEITDAAMAERAECVMLNKGPHLLKAVQTLDDILRRMQAHQLKKTSMLRSLIVAREPE